MACIKGKNAKVTLGDEQNNQEIYLGDWAEWDDSNSAWVTTSYSNSFDYKLYFTPQIPSTTFTIDNISCKEIKPEKPEKYLKAEICFYNENTDEFEVEEITIFESLRKFIEDNADHYDICSYKFTEINNYASNNPNQVENETFEDIDSIIEFLEGCQEIFKEAKEEIEQRQINKSNKINSQGHHTDGVNSTDIAKELVKKHSKTIKSRELIKKKTNKDLLGL